MSETTAAAEQTASGELEFGADLETEPGQDREESENTEDQSEQTTEEVGVAPSSTQTAEDSTSDDVTADFDPMSVDWTRLRQDQIPAEYQPIWRTARRLQSRSDREINKAKEVQQDSQRIYENQRTQPEAQAQTQTFPVRAGQSDPILEAFGYQTGQAGYDEASTVLGIAQTVVQPMQSEIQTLRGLVTALQQGYGNITEQGRETADKAAENEYDNAVEEFGEETIDMYWEEVKVLRGKPNRFGDGPHTISSVLQMLSGRPAEKSAELKTTARTNKRKAQRKTKPQSSAAPEIVDETADKTREQTIAELESNGW